MKKLTYEQVCEYFEQYGYKVIDNNYKDTKTPINVICPKGHKWKVAFGHFKSNNCRCAECRKLEKRYSQDFILETLNNNGYRLNKIFIKNESTYVNITCPKGHTYECSFESFKNKNNRCRRCSGSHKHTIEEVKEFANQCDYEVISDNYTNNKTHLIFKCPKDHIFPMRFDHFKSGSRCPFCRESKGEKDVLKYLDKYNIKYIRQYRYEDCKDTRTLPFDFYLPDYNTCIEYDGELHYKAIDFYGGEEELKRQQNRDSIKTQYCKDNNIKLIRIPYWELKNINKILSENL